MKYDDMKRNEVSYIVKRACMFIIFTLISELDILFSSAILHILTRKKIKNVHEFINYMSILKKAYIKNIFRCKSTISHPQKIGMASSYVF